jgi:hypothetical protein
MTQVSLQMKMGQVRDTGEAAGELQQRMQMRNASESPIRMQVHFVLGAGEVGTCCLGDEAGEPQERRKWER